MAGVSHRRWVWIGAGIAVLIGVAAGAVFLAGRLLRDTSTPLDVADTVDEFRNEENPADAVEDLATPGVYLYLTEGSEEIDALAGTRHDYPSETTVSVVTSGCGVEFRWDVLEERYESWELCRAEGGLAQPGYVSFHRFFGQPDTKSFVCEEGSLGLPEGVSVGAVWETDCQAGSLREVTAYEVVGLEDFELEGATIPSVHIRTATMVSGSSTGTSEGELWLALDGGLPLRWEETTSTTSRSAIGPVHYAESFAIRLASLDPRR